MSVSTPRTLDLRFTIHGEPLSKERARVVNGHAYTPRRTRDAEARVQAAWMAAAGRVSASDGPFYVVMHFFPGTRKRRDLDNMAKLVLDALNGWAWRDDSEVDSLSLFRHPVVPRDEARVEIQIVGSSEGNP